MKRKKQQGYYRLPGMDAPSLLGLQTRPAPRTVVNMAGQTVVKLSPSSTYGVAWRCSRCGEKKPEDRRASLTLAQPAGEGSGAPVTFPVCTFCASVIQSALERGTTLTPIVMSAPRPCFLKPLDTKTSANETEPEPDWEKRT